jgi:hypothetical protein
VVDVLVGLPGCDLRARAVAQKHLVADDRAALAPLAASA